MAMVAALRVFGRNRFLLSTKRKFLTFGTPVLGGFARFEKNGWEFSLSDFGPPASDPPDRRRLAETGLRLPSHCDDSYLYIYHPYSGIRFSFSAHDALRKWLEEKSMLNPLASELPSYGSPLLPAVDHEYDSAYVGRVLFEKPEALPLYINPVWEYIDWKTLHDEIVWTTNNEQISSMPSLYTYYHGDGPATFVNPKRVANGKKPKRKSLQNPLVNFKMRLYLDSCPSGEEGSSSCDLYLVVTDGGWFFYLYQLFSNCFGDKRIREMTMHCKFEQDIIYREIIERQSKDFEKRLSSLHEGLRENQDDEMCVYFHEAKQLKVQEAYMEGSNSCVIRDARRYISFTPGEWKRLYLGALDVSDDKIESLFANCGEQIQSIEEVTGTRIQIIPLFRHPYYPKVDPKETPAKVPRTAYIHGSENDIASAKSRMIMMNLPNLAD